MNAVASARRARARATFANFCRLAVVVPLYLAAPGVVSADDLTLIEAVKQGNQKAVRDLLGSADINAAEGDGASALHWAAHRNDVTIAELLLRAGSHVDA